jgi:hypothetical protein
MNPDAAPSGPVEVVLAHGQYRCAGGADVAQRLAGNEGEEVIEPRCVVQDRLRPLVGRRPGAVVGPDRRQVRPGGRRGRNGRDHHRRNHRGRSRHRGQRQRSEQTRRATESHLATEPQLLRDLAVLGLQAHANPPNAIPVVQPPDLTSTLQCDHGGTDPGHLPVPLGLPRPGLRPAWPPTRRVAWAHFGHSRGSDPRKRRGTDRCKCLSVPRVHLVEDRRRSSSQST